MCSLGGEAIKEQYASLIPDRKQLKICKKCSASDTSIVLRKTDSYCKSCFIAATVHKFRATIGKYRIITPNERVLICYRHGHPSTAILHFIRSALDITTHKRLRIEPVVLFIDDQTKISPEGRFEICKNVAQEISNYNFPCYFTSLPDYLVNIDAHPNYIELNNELNLDHFKDFKLKNTNRTQFDDMIATCRRRLLIEMAKELNCKVVFTPEISVNVAVQMLTNVSLGRGSHLSLDVGVYDDRDPDIKILQPLRYFEMKELAFYNIFNNIEPISAYASENKSNLSSVNQLIRKFVNDLQENFPSTIKTVVRTGDKLTCEKTEAICNICKAPVEMQEELSSSEARDFSHWVSTHAKQLNNIDYVDSENSDGAKNLCYGCKKVAGLLKDYLIE